MGKREDEHQTAEGEKRDVILSKMSKGMEAWWPVTP
jgi:hypothetical protein